jgi:hypothetical protein
MFQKEGNCLYARPCCGAHGWRPATLERGKGREAGTAVFIVAVVMVRCGLVSVVASMADATLLCAPLPCLSLSPDVWCRHGMHCWYLRRCVEIWVCHVDNMKPYHVSELRDEVLPIRSPSRRGATWAVLCALPFIGCPWRAFILL